jgi:formylmethanofuran dehydrogenase subunit E
MGIPDNYDMFRQHDRQQAERERDKPICCECERPIYNEYAYRLGGRLYCAECVGEGATYIEEE